LLKGYISTIQEEVLNEGVEDHDDFVILNHNDSVLLTVMETRNVDSGGKESTHLDDTSLIFYIY